MKIGTCLKYTISNEMSKVPIDPTGALKNIQGQMSKISGFCIFLVNGKCHHKIGHTKVVDHSIFYKNCIYTFFIRVTIPQILRFKCGNLLFYIKCSTTFRQYQLIEKLVLLVMINVEQIIVGKYEPESYQLSKELFP